MKLNSAISKFFTNKWVLNIISFIALFNVIGHMVIGNYNLVVYFIILALLVRYFSKNMIVVLGVPLILVNMLSLNNGSYMEGMETEGEGEDKNMEQDKMMDKDKNMEQDKKKKTTTTKEKKTEEEDEPVAEKFEVGRSKNRGNLHKIDYATTIEDAYDQLNSILGKDGIKSLTADTERLMQQQQQLTGSLKDMGPLMEKMGPMMEQAKSMMDGFSDDQKGDVASKMKGIMGMLSPKEK